MLAGHIAPQRLSARVYHEPFVGSAAVATTLAAMGRIRGGMVLTDANWRLMATHQAVRDNPGAVHEAMLALGDTREPYYEVRAAFNAHPRHGYDPTAVAAQMLWLNRAGFNGLYRENRKGEYNVPVGRGRLRLPPLAVLEDHAVGLAGAVLERATWDVALGFVQDDSVVYCDPPYLPEPPADGAASAFTAYQAGGFGQADHEALARACEAAARRGAVVVMSNALHAGTRALYPAERGWHLVETLTVERRIGGKSNRRDPAPEGVWVCAGMAG